MYCPYFDNIAKDYFYEASVTLAYTIKRIMIVFFNI